MDTSILPYHAVNSQMTAPNHMAQAIKITTAATLASGSMVGLASDAVRTFVDHHVEAVSNHVRAYAKGLYDGFTTPANDRPLKQARGNQPARDRGEKRRDISDPGTSAPEGDRTMIKKNRVAKPAYKYKGKGRRVRVRKVNNLRRKSI